MWATKLDASADLETTADKQNFVHLADLRPDESGQYPFTLSPGYVYTFSTLATAGKGRAEAPPASSLKLPYRDNFDHYRNGQEARYASDMQGSFEIQPCAADRPGKCLQQMAAMKPIEWQEDSDAFTLLGDPSWTDYTVSVDVQFTKPGALELIGRAGTQRRPQSRQQGYYFQISNTGAWTIFKSDSKGNRTKLADGSTVPLGTGRWHRLGLSLNSETITASVDGQNISTLKDNSYQSGQIGLGITSYDTHQFD